MGIHSVIELVMLMRDAPVSSAEKRWMAHQQRHSHPLKQMQLHGSSHMGKRLLPVIYMGVHLGHESQMKEKDMAPFDW